MLRRKFCFSRDVNKTQPRHSADAVTLDLIYKSKEEKNRKEKRRKEKQEIKER
jgi:hypothetical protein